MNTLQRKSLEEAKEILANAGSNANSLWYDMMLFSSRFQELAITIREKGVEESLKHLQRLKEISDKYAPNQTNPYGRICDGQMWITAVLDSDEK